MFKSLVLIVFLLVGYVSTAYNAQTGKVDDWEYNATKEHSNKRVRSLRMPTIQTAPIMKSLGLSVGGAKDANNFYENIKRGYLPKVDSITYEGVFYDHYFDIKAEHECKELFCPKYATAREKNPFSGELEAFLAVGLDSNIDLQKFKRRRLNLVVVLDISGSMGAPFDSYYYDRFGNRVKNSDEKGTPKIKIATESIVHLIDHLKGDDSLGIVLFDDRSYIAKPLRTLSQTDIKAIKKHILELRERGGTNWSAGYKEALKLFRTKELDKNSENRIIFITDAMPNRGELSKGGLFDLAKEASKRGIYTTFIGVGVDFNNDLVEAISKTRGANYYSIHSSKEFQKRLDNEFEYMVTPLVFDLKLSLNSPAYKIEAVYGSPDANRATGEIMYVNTLFPTPTDESGVKGGIILLKLKKLSDTDKPIELNIEYQDRDGKHYSSSKEVWIGIPNLDIKKVRLDALNAQYYQNHSIKKAIVLARYVDVMKNFLIDAHKSCNDNVTLPYPALLKHISIYPPDRAEFTSIKTWERRSCKLEVSEGYQKLLKLFRNYFHTKMKEIGDKSLEKELKALDLLIGTQSKDSGKIDDWIGIK